MGILDLSAPMSLVAWGGNTCEDHTLCSNSSNGDKKASMRVI